MDNSKVFAMKFSLVYPLLAAKAVKKGRSQQEVEKVLFWLTGYDKAGLDAALAGDVDYGAFFEKAPAMHPNCHKITGSVCGVKLQEIEDPLMQRICYFDKLVDELAKGKAMDKILRK